MLEKIRTTWPELWQLRASEISAPACKDWVARLEGEISSHYFNNTIATLRLLIQTGLTMQKDQGGGVIENPAREIKRARVKPKNLRLPEPSQFNELVANIRTKSGAWGEHDGDLVEFLASSGMRSNSAAVWVTWDDVDWKRSEIVVRGNPQTATKNGEVRRMPILPDMKTLLTRLKSKSGVAHAHQIMTVGECRLTLTRACLEMGLARITHHDLRHLFATRCIESGVDIQTVSR